MANDPKNFKIPSEFTLFGHKYAVEMSDTCFCEESIYGDADDDAKRIRVQTAGLVTRTRTDNDIAVTSSVNITPEIVIETYYHELAHIVFDAIGEEELSDNEKLINMIGKAFLEIYLSSRYEKPTE